VEVAVPGLEGRQVAVLHLHAASAGHVTSAPYYCVKEVSVRQGTKCAMAQNTLEHQESAELLRRLMCNELDEQVRQMSERSAEGVVDPLSTGVGRDLGREARQQPTQRLRSVALQAEDVLELADHPLDDLALS
jgi:hypothetical protein